MYIKKMKISHCFTAAGTIVQRFFSSPNLWLFLFAVCWMNRKSRHINNLVDKWNMKYYTLVFNLAFFINYTFHRSVFVQIFTITLNSSSSWLFGWMLKTNKKVGRKEKKNNNGNFLLNKYTSETFLVKI